MKRFRPFTGGNYNGVNFLSLPQKSGWFALDSIDMEGVKSVNIVTGWQAAPKAGFAFEARLDAPGGPLLGQGNLPVPKAEQKSGSISIPLQQVNDGKYHTLYFVYKPKDPSIVVQAAITTVKFNSK